MIARRGMNRRHPDGPLTSPPRLVAAPGGNQRQTICNNPIERLIRVHDTVGAVWQCHLQIEFNAVSGSARKVARVGTGGYAFQARRILSAEKEELCLAWGPKLHEQLEDANVANAINNEVVAGAEPACGEHSATECGGIRLDQALTKLLKAFAVSGSAARLRHFGAQIITEPRASPTQCRCHGGTDRRFAAANLACEAQQHAHRKPRLIWRDLSDTQPRRSRLSHATGAILAGESSSISVAYSASARVAQKASSAAIPFPKRSRIR